MSTDVTDEVVDVEVEDPTVAEDSENVFGTATDETNAPTTRRWSPTRLAMMAGLVTLIGLSGVLGWVGYQLHQSQLAAAQRAAFVQGARQGAINLTTIDWQHADADVKRISDSATGTFYDDFSKRSGPFADAVKQAQSKSEGTIALAGLESVAGNQAKVLVAVSVTTVAAGVQQPSAQTWRMRMDVQRVGNDVKIANVEFVP